MVWLDHWGVDRMKVLDDNELFNVIGGVSISGTLIKSFASAITTVVDIGRSFGTALRRIWGKAICSIR